MCSDELTGKDGIADGEYDEVAEATIDVNVEVAREAIAVAMVGDMLLSV